MEIEAGVFSLVVVRDGWLEGNVQDSVRMAWASGCITGLNIIGGYQDDTQQREPRRRPEYTPIRSTKNAAGCDVLGNQVWGGGRRGGQTRIERNSELHNVSRNFRFYRARGWVA
ncbi:MAG: hypothetical protein NC911_06105 [Candidatus Omnitrophica bacterium]|nr:hypothetical protein [Candidatus Omnitrophota bacterium]